MNRLKESVYGENTGSGFTANLNGYSESGITYDKNGNLLSLRRYSAGVLVDILSYTYENSGASNRLLGVSDMTGNSAGFTDVAGADYSYDTNGNATKDLNKGITGISYNVLNLPLTVTKDASNSLSYVYSAGGEKLAQSTKVNGVTTVRYYAGAFEYDNAKALSLFKMGEGIVTRPSGAYVYEYYLKDHLGNTRVSFTPSGQVPVMAQRTDYYPFGLVSGQYQASTGNKYLYNGKELQSALNWNVYDYGARFYDAAIGRWHSVDPSSDEQGQEVFSPYCYVGNNPISHNDPDGKILNNIVGAFIGAATEYGGQVVANAIDGKGWNSFTENIDVGDIMIAGGEGFLTSGGSAIKSVVKKTLVAAGAELMRNTVDWNAGDVAPTFNSADKVIKNTAIGLTANIGAKVAPQAKTFSTKTQNQAVQQARATAKSEGKVLTKEARKEVVANVKENKKIAKTLNDGRNQGAASAASETIKRKTNGQ